MLLFRGMKKLLLLGVIIWCCSLMAQAQVVRDSVTVHFQINSDKLDWDLPSNRASLERIKDKLRRDYNDTTYWELRKVEVVGAASPEGPLRLNKALSEKRANTLFDYISTLCNIPDSLMTSRMVEADWEGLIRMAEADGSLPMRDKTLKHLREIADNAKKSEWLRDISIYRLKKLGGGKPYQYIARHFFPLQRHSVIHLWYTKVTLPSVSDSVSLSLSFNAPSLSIPWHAPDSFDYYYLAVKSNLLYDAVTALNFSIEVPLGDKYSILYQQHFPWWERGNKYCMQFLTFGGEFRWWLAPSAVPASLYGRKNDYLLGHFVGLNAWGGKADIQIGRNFGCYQFEFWSAGLTYGYSFPISRLFNLEFTVSAGYAHIPYQHYIPSENWEVLIKDRNKVGTLNYWGITKAEVNLVMPLQFKKKWK